MRVGERERERGEGLNKRQWKNVITIGSKIVNHDEES